MCLLTVELGEPSLLPLIGNHPFEHLKRLLQQGKKLLVPSLLGYLTDLLLGYLTHHLLELIIGLLLKHAFCDSYRILVVARAHQKLGKTEANVRVLEFVALHHLWARD